MLLTFFVNTPTNKYLRQSTHTSITHPTSAGYQAVYSQAAVPLHYYLRTPHISTKTYQP